MLRFIELVIGARHQILHGSSARHELGDSDAHCHRQTDNDLIPSMGLDYRAETFGAL